MLDIQNTLEGRTIAQYQLKERIGRGGMSEIFLATDTQRRRDVAIKLVPLEQVEYSRRFHYERRAIAELTHDHILPAFESGEYNSWCYMVMPYIQNGTLRQRIARNPLTEKEAGAILVQIADALQYAHDHGIIHRDIKPSNILLRDGQHAYLSDFGLVKRLDRDQAITKEGYLLGTPEYMAPELAQQPATKSSDIYALGIVLYEMLTGRPPFKSTSPMAIHWKHIQEQPLPPSQLNSALSPAVDAVVLQALAKDPAQRFQTPQELAHAYCAAIATPTDHHTSHISSIQAVSTPTVSKARKKRIARPLATAMLAFLCIVALPTCLGFSLYYLQHPSQISTSLKTGMPLMNAYPPIHPAMQPTPTATVTPTPTITTVVLTSHTGSKSTSNNKSISTHNQSSHTTQVHFTHKDDKQQTKNHGDNHQHEQDQQKNQAHNHADGAAKHEHKDK